MITELTGLPQTIFLVTESVKCETRRGKKSASTICWSSYRGLLQYNQVCRNAEKDENARPYRITGLAFPY